ncbi:MAG: hypothetical protein K2X66_01635, partial [Cyanobacteria bacterium]|nr:hypothetical protein [Cyanobacteriota bacterium]
MLLSRMPQVTSLKPNATASSIRFKGSAEETQQLVESLKKSFKALNPEDLVYAGKQLEALPADYWGKSQQNTIDTLVGWAISNDKLKPLVNMMACHKAILGAFSTQDLKMAFSFNDVLGDFFPNEVPSSCTGSLAALLVTIELIFNPKRQNAIMTTLIKARPMRADLKAALQSGVGVVPAQEVSPPAAKAPVVPQPVQATPVISPAVPVFKKPSIPAAPAVNPTIPPPPKASLSSPVVPAKTMPKLTFNAVFDAFKDFSEGQVCFELICNVFGHSADNISASGGLQHRMFEVVGSLERNGNLESIGKALGFLQTLEKDLSPEQIGTLYKTLKPSGETLEQFADKASTYLKGRV